MNPAAGCTAQRQSGTLIAALKTRVADQSSDACQYFRIIAEGCLLLISLSLFLSFPLYHLLSRQFPSSFFTFDYFLLLLCHRPYCFEFARKAKRVSRAKPNDVQAQVFLKRPDDALMRPGLCGWTEAADFARDQHE